MNVSNDSLMGKRSAAFIRSENLSEGEDESSDSDDDNLLSVNVSSSSGPPNVKRQRKETGDCIWKEGNCGGQLIHGSEYCFIDTESDKTVCFCKPPPKINYAQQFYFMQYVLLKKMHLLKPGDIVKGWMTFAVFLFQTPEFQSQGNTIKESHD
jgi:hypothetical protein